MPYWILFKNGKYVFKINENNHMLHTYDKNKAYKFYDFDIAMNYFNYGYSIQKVS